MRNHVLLLLIKMQKLYIKNKVLIDFVKKKTSKKEAFFFLFYYLMNNTALYFITIFAA